MGSAPTSSRRWLNASRLAQEPGLKRLLGQLAKRLKVRTEGPRCQRIQVVGKWRIQLARTVQQAGQLGVVARAGQGPFDKLRLAASAMRAITSRRAARLAFRAQALAQQLQATIQRRRRAG